MPKTKGLFIVLEGPDKSGKSTQAALLGQALDAQGYVHVHTREPGGTGVELAETLRKTVLDPAYKVDPIAELFIYEAARAQHVSEFIRPALKRGAVVVCERFTMASLAYQGLARGLGLDLTRKINDIATGGLHPDMTVILDIPDSEFESRDPERELDRLEAESTSFRRKVRRAYRDLAKSEKGAIVVDAARPPHAVHTDIVAQVSGKLKRPLTPVPLDPTLLKSST